MPEKTIYVRLYRTLDVPVENVKADLDRLSEFIKNRSMSNRDVTYITVTYIRKQKVDGIIVIMGGEEEAEKEAEIITGFVGSELEGVVAERISRPKITLNLPLPGPKRFLLEKQAQG